METRKVAVIGLGHVGAQTAYTLAVQGTAEELILVDQNEEKVTAQQRDLEDAAAFLPHRVRITVGKAADLGPCDVIINSVGDISLTHQSRDRAVESRFTSPAVKAIAAEIRETGFDGVLLNITNPCDLITWQLIRELDLPRGRVFGTGVGLDTARLTAGLSRRTGLSHSSVTAYMLGEHGKAQFAPWSCVRFGGKSLDDWAETESRFRFNRDKAEREAVDAAWVTMAGKGCTEYGIAATAARMVAAVLRDEKVILPVSCALCGEYGERDVVAGVPAVIGRDGAEQVVELPLTDGEKARFRACCGEIRQSMSGLNM